MIFFLSLAVLRLFKKDILKKDMTTILNFFGKQNYGITIDQLKTIILDALNLKNLTPASFFFLVEDCRILNLDYIKS